MGSMYPIMVNGLGLRAISILGFGIGEFHIGLNPQP